MRMDASLLLHLCIYKYARLLFNLTFVFFKKGKVIALEYLVGDSVGEVIGRS